MSLNYLTFNPVSTLNMTFQCDLRSLLGIPSSDGTPYVFETFFFSSATLSALSVAICCEEKI